MSSRPLTDEDKAELPRVASLYNDLQDAADGGGPIQIDEFEASSILAMIQDPEYAKAVREEWERTFDTKANDPKG